MIELSSWLAQDPPPPAQGPEFGGASPIGLLVILLLGIALFFLIRSMNKHLAKVPRSFENNEERAKDKAKDKKDTAAKADKTEQSGKSADKPASDSAKKS